MEREIIYTEDGSHSISVPEMNVTYHSIHGAIQESMHVFIEAGLNAPGRLERPDAVRIFEMGFGTGLNILLTLIESEKLNQNIHYETIEPYPLSPHEAKMLNYCNVLQRDDLQKTFERFHECEWDAEISICLNFSFLKRSSDLLSFETSEMFDLIYFDAFAPNVQPELWTQRIFEKMFSILRPGGILTTYCSKVTVRGAMQAAGFAVEKIAGPPGKREIVRAVKGRLQIDC